ncbi:MAG: 3-phosphoshikimate 1-carboxyvinyltransferase [Synergistaceae bacterium]|jgi:3-phosphoshikimate 1-carboxyvinyltransferase|nr:3-phosphoshikimate 1-carboxyvinyltransferase [Synergistaceae bacterium]
MKLRVKRSEGLGGSVAIPGSKSHTIRSLFIASLAEGESIIRAPLISKDAISAVTTCRAFGAEVTEEEGLFRVRGFGRTPRLPGNIVDVGNSGTTMIFSICTAALVRAEGATVLTGDEQTRRRPLGPLIDALSGLGIEIFSTGNNGNPPVVVRGAAKMSRASSCRIDAQISQYLSSLLIHAPLFEKDIDVEIIKLLEVPYVEMTLWWLDRFGIRYENRDFKHFHIYGGQSYRPFDRTIPGDFSSATFFAVLAAISGAEIFMKNLDMSDVQGDKEVVRMLERMGARVTVKPGGVAVKGDRLTGARLDLGDTPDAICAMAVAGCFAEGETRLENVPQARLKETDRIAVMATELKKMGADVEEQPDGLIIRRSVLKGAELNGYGDHRVVMSLATAGLVAGGVTTVSGAEAASVTFPEFIRLIKECGGDIETID